jgi:hypothetical protein
VTAGSAADSARKIVHEGADPLAALHRRADPLRKWRPRARAAGRATAAVRSVYRDDQRSRFGEVTDLAGDVVGCHRRQSTPRRTSHRAVGNGRSWHHVPRFGATSHPDGPSAHRSSQARKENRRSHGLRRKSSSRAETPLYWMMVQSLLTLPSDPPPMTLVPLSSDSKTDPSI